MSGEEETSDAVSDMWSPGSVRPTRGSVDSTRLVRANGWSWEHEVRIYLPPSYQLTDISYPTLWITDNDLELVQGALSGDALGLAPELIVVAVGAPPQINPAERQRRRTYEFTPEKALLGPLFAANEDGALGGAAGFLDFLVNQLRPELAKEYRFDLKDQAYAGHSGGAQFGLYVLLNKPESFSKYIISSPGVYQPWLDMETRWNETNEDLNANVFLSAGELEMNDEMSSRMQVVSTVATIAERLTIRAYPSLELTTRIFPGEDHASVVPFACAKGIRVLWG